MKRLFHSRWRVALQEFLDFKRIGCAYTSQEKKLQSFDRFAAQHSRWSLRQVVEQWIARIPGRRAVTVRRDLIVARHFCLFRRRFDPRAFVPEFMPLAPSARIHFQPSLLSMAQVKMLLRERNKRHPPLLRARIRALLLILYCTGLRISEVLGLHLTDVDLKRAYFRVGPTKGRVRLVPFGRDLARELKHWLNLRRRAGFVLTPQTPLFERKDGQPGTRHNAWAVLTALFRRCGLKPKHGRQGLRVHDLRHAFCIHRLELWYRAGVDPGPLLPWLSAYVGHVDLLGTEKYLHATPELLAAASRRFLRSLDFDPAHP
jgi:site-specific recombinase XerD